jgi:hypothetical protein
MNKNTYNTLQEWIEAMAQVRLAERMKQAQADIARPLCDMCHYEPVTRFRGSYGYCQECLYELDCGDNDD